MNHLFKEMCKNDGLRQRFMIAISSVQVIFSIIVMLILNIQPILWVNIGGLIALFFSFYVIKKRRTYLLYAAFTIYAAGSILLTTLYLEEGYGFVYYLIMIIPFGFVILYDVITFNKVVISTLLGTTITIISYALYQLLLDINQPVSIGGHFFQEIVLFINIFLIMVILFVFFLMFSFRLECSKEREKQMRDQLTYEANHDKLTGLYNRKFIDVLLDKIQVSSLETYLLLADLNGFKKINDTYGHQMGDQVLIDVAQIIQKHLQSDCYALRWGGEEFIIVCMNQTIDFVNDYVVRLKKDIEAIHYESYPQLNISIAVGISKHDPNKTIDITIQMADQRMYEDKTKYKSTHK